ncbi:MAG: hypothetical protein R3D98_14805 [Candidatus Krumholzibacteriia bacterium]
MSDFLIAHRTFAYWGAIYLIMGLVVTIAWSLRFRRLAATAIAAGELRWEAWRGVLGGAAWLVILASIVLLMVASYDISAVEAIAASDPVSDALLEAVTRERHLITAPATGGFALAGLALLISGAWSGALAALRGEVRHG